jgi:4-amino-4-deoxy-L-arabinose transferase-like glycosyltransferase
MLWLGQADDGIRPLAVTVAAIISPVSAIADSRRRGAPIVYSRTADRLRRRLGALFGRPRAPLVLLGIVCVAAVGLRAWHLGNPAKTPGGGGYVFDERYYVSAAQIIAGETTGAGNLYVRAAPPGSDPNGEHPQLGKMVIAAGISVFGDNAIGWRITAVAFGLASLLLLYWFVRCAGGGPWLSVGATALAGAENLWLVHSRIAVLDIYVVPFMLAGAAFYLRRQPLIAGVVIGIGACVKEFAAYMLLVLLLFELMRVAGRRVTWTQLARPMLTVVAAGLTFFTLLSALDTVVTPYSGGHPVDRNEAGVCRYLLLWRDGCNHFAFMNRYAATLHGTGGAHGIAAAPTEFWIDRRAIPYYEASKTITAGRRRHVVQLVAYRGEIGRVLLFTSLLALALNLWWAIRRRDELSFLVLAWTLGTWLPPELFYVIDDRTTYLYYMVVTMPALYLAVARLLALRRIPLLLKWAWAGALIWDLVALYPIRTLTGT